MKKGRNNMNILEIVAWVVTIVIFMLVLTDKLGGKKHD